jgi:hypothetical protein
MNDHKLIVRVLVNTILSPLVGYTQLPLNFLLLLFFVKEGALWQELLGLQGLV